MPRPSAGRRGRKGARGEGGTESGRARAATLPSLNHGISIGLLFLLAAGVSVRAVSAHPFDGSDDERESVSSSKVAEGSSDHEGDRILNKSPPMCPPGTIYGLRPASAAEKGDEDETAGRRRRRRRRKLGGRRSVGGRSLQNLDMEMGCVERTKFDEVDRTGTCLNALPYGEMHAVGRPDEVVSYQEYEIKMAGGPGAASTRYDGELPETTTLPPGSSFANWDCHLHPEKCKNGLVDGISKITGSAWTAEGQNNVFAEGIGRWGKGRGRWGPVEWYEGVADPRRKTVLRGVGDVVAHTGFNPLNFGHILHDNLPAVAWLRHVAPDNTTFLLPDTKIFRQLLEFIDPDFARERVAHWYKPNEVVTVEDGTITISNQAHMFGKLGNTLWRYLRHWIAEGHPPPEERIPDRDRTVVYYARGSIPDGKSNGKPRASAHTMHGRILDPRHELDILSSIRSAMERHGLSDRELVFFTGSDSEGNILPYQAQMDVFRRASAVIGPHGSGLANVVWTDPFPPSCEDRVKVLEFIPGTDSAQVQQLYNGYYWNMRGLPLEWHQIAYAPNSTEDVTYVRLVDLEDALDAMWGPRD